MSRLESGQMTLEKVQFRSAHALVNDCLDIFRTVQIVRPLS